MKKRNIGFIIFGIILLTTGLVAYSYSYTKKYWSYSNTGPVASTPFFLISTVYPYQNEGILLTVAGIVFIALGLLYSLRKTRAQLLIGS